MNKFVQIHFLTSYPAALLNRDDAGFAKRIPFGDVVRTRISSQCQKRSWRTFTGAGGLQEIGVPLALRSRITFQVRVYKPLLDEKVPEELARLVTDGLQGLVLGNKPEAEKAPKPPRATKAPQAADDASKAPAEAAKAGGEAGETPTDKVKMAGKTEQVTVLGVLEMDAMLAKAREILRTNKTVDEVKTALADLSARRNKAWLDSFRSMPSSLDTALFGRMITGDVLADMHAAIHVAHAFTVHAEQTEPDYFSAIDDLLVAADDGARGSGHINSTELTSGLYYGFVSVDVDLLRQNVSGLRKDRNPVGDTVAREVLSRLVRIIATVTPGAKLGSTAPHARALFVLIERGDAQPRSLANAFLDPVRTTRESPQFFANACDALAGHINELDAMYGREFDRSWSGVSVSPQLVSTLGSDGRNAIGELQLFAAGAL